MQATAPLYASTMRQRRADRDFTYVQVRLPNELHRQLTDLAESHNRTINGEFVELARIWLRISERDRAALSLKAAEAS